MTAAASDPRPVALSLVIPAYNEEATVRQTLAKCCASLDRLCADYEILVVDDASTDATPRVVEELAGADRHIRLLRNGVNLGAGTSLLVGLRAATRDVLVHNSMDYPFDLDDLARVLPRLAEADVVVVVRTSRDAHSPWRRLTSFVHHWLVRLLFGVPFRDMNFVQAYRREVLAQLRVKARSPAFVTPELLIRARDRGLRVAEVEATFHPRRAGRANYGRARDILWTMADMASLWIERRQGER